ncbi:MAG: patatin-like phospholipase family protein, partial [Thermodesulfobacteriota bacterium]|nr:patatin-like phospholipase family protein [Thermodesulfobacteriota bacterium]
FACTAVDLWTGAEVILKDGSIRKAVSASCAIPGVLAPISFNGSELVDGGVVDCVPIQPAFKMGAHLVIGVDVAHDIEDLQVDTALDIAFRANDISRMTLRKLQLKEANVVIRPEVNDILWSDFSRMDECVNRGMEATRMKILEIKRLIRKKKIKRFFR